jgi:hypothetical protein
MGSERHKQARPHSRPRVRSPHYQILALGPSIYYPPNTQQSPRNRLQQAIANYPHPS